MDNLYPDLETAPESGKILWHIPYDGTRILTKQADGTWLDNEAQISYSSETITDDVEATWQKYGDDWNGHSFDWAKEANRLQDVINNAEELLSSDEPEDWAAGKQLLSKNKE